MTQADTKTPKDLFAGGDHDAIGAIYYGIFDRLVDQSHAIVNIVWATTDWPEASPANLRVPEHDSGPADMDEARRMAVLVDQIDGCHHDTSILIWMDPETGQPMQAQIAGPEADGDIAKCIIARDVGAAPAEPPKPSPMQEPLAKLTADLFPPKADNQNDQKIGKFTVTRFSALGNARPKKHIVKGVRAAGEASYTAAKPGGGKSVIETDIAYHIAAGREWHGHKVTQGLAVYFAAERKAVTDRRIMALQQHYSDRDIPLVVIGGKPNLTDDKSRDVMEMARIIRLLESEYGLPCRHVTIDTLARTFGGKNMNAAEDMLKFVHSIDVLMDNLPEAHINVIHHEGHETGRAKGAIDLDGAVDVSFRVTKSGETFKLICDGANDGVEGDILSFTMRGVKLGEDEDGEPITAPIVVKGADVAGFVEAQTEKVQERAEREAMAIIEELAAGGHAVGGGMWLAKYRELYPDEKPNTAESRWKRAVKALEKAGRVESSGRPKVYTIVGVQDGVHAPFALAPCTNDPSDSQGAKVQVHPLSKGCTHAPAPDEGLDDDELTEDDDFEPPAFLKKDAA